MRSLNLEGSINFTLGILPSSPLHVTTKGNVDIHNLFAKVKVPLFCRPWRHVLEHKFSSVRIAPTRHRMSLCVYPKSSAGFRMQ